MDPYAFAYLDEIIVIGATSEEQAQNFQEVSHRLRAANLRLNWEKLQFFLRCLVYLGHLICAESVSRKSSSHKGVMLRNICKNFKS